MKFLGGNADFRAQPHFAAISKAGGSIVINSCRVDRDKKFICCLLIAGHNAVAVVGGVLLDVSNGFFYRVDNLYAENEIEIFLPEAAGVADGRIARAALSP